MSEQICNGNIQTTGYVKIGNFGLSEVSFENPNAPDFKGRGYLNVAELLKLVEKGQTVIEVIFSGWAPQQKPYYSNTAWKPTKKDTKTAPIAVVPKKKLPKGKVAIP